MIHSLIYKHYPQAISIVDETAYDKDGLIVPIDIEMIKNEAKKLEYMTFRAQEYPSFAEQFDLLYHGGLEEWRSAIKVIKDKYPKG